MFIVTFSGHFKEVIDMNSSVVLVQYCHDLSNEIMQKLFECTLSSIRFVSCF